MARPARILVALLLVMTVVQAVSLIRRGSRGDSDVSVFYRTSVLLNTGVGGELYPRPASLPPLLETNEYARRFFATTRLPPGMAQAVFALSGIRGLLATLRSDEQRFERPRQFGCGPPDPLRPRRGLPRARALGRRGGRPRSGRAGAAPGGRDHRARAVRRAVCGVAGRSAHRGELAPIAVATIRSQTR